MNTREKYRGASTAGLNVLAASDVGAQQALHTFNKLLKEENQPVHAIAHIDLDGFYAAVERRRLQRPASHCLAVQQWGSLIAVDYNCRRYGVKRGMSVEDALKLCPDLECVHVGLIGSQSDATKHNKANAKVSLARYRRASFEVIDIFLKFAAQHGAIVQRTSIDESYLDFTPVVEKYLRGKRLDGLNLTELLGSTHVVGSLDPLCTTDVGLAVASHFVNILRAQVQEKLSFTVSAGIAQNKLLAKIGSSRNKPNKQTLIPLHMTPQVLRTLALRGVPGLGGKWGHQVEDIILKYHGLSKDNNNNNINNTNNAKKSSEDEVNALISHVQDVNETTLIKLFGKDNAHALHRKCHGIFVDAVEPSWKPKSLLAMKSFWPPLETQSQFDTWLHLLVTELVERIGDDRKMCNRLPKTMVVHLRVHSLHKTVNGTNQNLKRTDCTCTVRQPMPRDCEKVESLMAAVRHLCSKQPNNALPLTRLGISAENFHELPNPKQQISNFFAATSTSGFSTNDFQPPPQKKQKIRKTNFFSSAKTSESSSPASSSSSSSSSLSPSLSPSSSSSSAAAAAAAAAAANFTTHSVLTHSDDTQSLPSSSILIKDGAAESTLIATFCCDKCSINIPMHQIAEHADYHVALELSKEHGAVQRMKARDDSNSMKNKNKNNKISSRSGGLYALFGNVKAGGKKNK